MARPDPEQALRPSLLDRLIDREPRVPAEPDSARAIRLPQIKEGLRRDLEWLLNTKRSLVPVPPGSKHLGRSLLTYGLPDFTDGSLEDGDTRQRLIRAIEVSVRRFEPRLTDVAVTLVEEKGLGRQLRFRIDALLDLDPAPEAITFDSVLRLATRDFVVEED
jgi:type VI secretion system protein ImpF